MTDTANSPPSDASVTKELLASKSIEENIDAPVLITEDAADAVALDEVSDLSFKEEPSMKKRSPSSKFGRIFRSRSKSDTSAPTVASTPATENPQEASPSPADEAGNLKNTDDAQVAPSSEEETRDESPVRKAKTFKRIRGLLSGDSRKERREQRAKEKAARKAAQEEKKSKKTEESAAKKAVKAGTEAADADADAEDATDPSPTSGGNLSVAPSADEDDASTVFNVDVDERSQATPSVASTAGTHNKGLAEGDGAFFQGADAKKPYMLKVVLLLMDPQTRRFELLQLEFDSLKALVADVLKQIPQSVTEAALRDQEYMGICGKDGKLMDSDKLLSDFCAGNDVLVAIPNGMPPKECARLARPILSDEKVVSMLSASGIDTKGWNDKKPKRKSVRGLADDGEDEPKLKKKTGSRIGILSVITSIALAILFQIGHIYSSAAIKPGHAVQPGVLLRKCGVFSFLPPNPLCKDDARLVFTKDGHATLYGSNNEAVWEIEGAVCNPSNKDCSPELRFNDDLTLSMAGKPITTVKVYKDAELFPWPFAEKPKVRFTKK